MRKQYEFFMAWKEKSQHTVARLSYPPLIGCYLHFFEPDCHFWFGFGGFLLLILGFFCLNSLILECGICCSVHCASVVLSDCLCLVFMTVVPSLLSNTVTRSFLRVSGIWCLLPAWICHLPHAVTVFALPG